MPFLKSSSADAEQKDFYTLIKASETLPSDYVHYRSCKEFLDREERVKKRYFTIGEKGCYGQYWNLGPWKFENYYSDQEPKIEKGGPFRMVIWQPVLRKEKPKGWLRLRVGASIQRSGFVDLKDGINYKSWTPHAQRHIKKWFKEQDKWEIVEPTMEEFIQAYKKSPKDIVLKSIFIDVLKKEIKAQGDNVRMFCAKRKESKELEAGFVCVDIPEIKQSIHLISYLNNSAKNSSVAYGLVDHWFKSMIEKELRFADFCVFWKKGDPRSWRGFSKFKSQFGVQFIDYPKPLVRWAGRLFDL